MSESRTVHAIIPLSLLEALRNLDTPVDDGLEEVAGEIVSKRLGLSATVAAQIGRYQEDVARGRQVALDEAVAVFRLAGRRPDSNLVFADAGRRAARYATRENVLPVRALVAATPGVVSRRIGARAAATAARRVLRAELHTRDSGVEARVLSPLSIRAVPDGGACGFYSAAFGELLRCLTGFEGAVIHEKCRGRGEEGCRWKTTVAEAYE